MEREHLFEPPPSCPNTCSLSTVPHLSNWCLPPANLAA